MTTIIIISFLLIGFAFWWFFGRNPQPAIPPLTLDPDDPLMKEAMLKAQETLTDLRILFKERPDHCNVKVPFKTSEGELEYLWAELLKFDDDRMDVRLITPPVTHTGALERLQKYSSKDIVDWTMTKDDGSIQGGYTMRVMFVRGREQWGDLPPELKEEEKKYV